MSSLCSAQSADSSARMRSISAFSLALIQRIYRRYGTIEMRELLERAKKEDD